MQGEHNRQKITDSTVLNQSQMIYSFKPSIFYFIFYFRWEVHPTDRPSPEYSNAPKYNSPYSCKVTRKMQLNFT